MILRSDWITIGFCCRIAHGGTGMPAQQKKLEGSPQREEEEGFAFIDNSLTPFEGVLGSAYTGVPGR